MEGLRIPNAANWLLVAGGEGGARCRAPRVLHFRAPSGGALQGAFSRFLIWRRATAVAPIFPRPPSPFSAFPSADQQEEVKTEEDVSLVETQTASEPPVAAAKTELSAEASQPPAATEPLEAAGTETDTTQSKTQASSEAQESSEAETVKAEIVTENEPRTVRVRFMLQKSCEFGEHFLLVGEHHALGSWNPDKAIPLEWSDGHVWAADDLELPVGEEIKYKFILHSLSGKIKWQPGLDKVLQTYESADAIVVTGDWESAADEKTAEEKEKISEDSTAAGADGEGATESIQSEVADGNLKDTVEAGEEKPVVQQGDPVLIPGLTPLAESPTEAEAKTAGASGEITDSPPVVAAEVGSSTEEVSVW